MIPRTELSLRVVIDNHADAPGLPTSWGFACLVRAGAHTLLFDTGGDGPLLLANLAALGEAPAGIDQVVCSHAHHDHTGGLADLLAANPAPRVVLLSVFPDDLQATVRAAAREVLTVDGPQEIAPGVHTTGALGADLPEQSLVVDTNAGLLLITGCAHPGVVKIVEAAARQHGRQVRWVLGGFHLRDESGAALHGIVDRLRALGVRGAGPCHCSGDLALEVFAERFGAGYLRLGTGTRLDGAALP